MCENCRKARKDYDKKRADAYHEWTYARLKISNDYIAKINSAFTRLITEEKDCKDNGYREDEA